jgi:hypothetical protein
MTRLHHEHLIAMLILGTSFYPNLATSADSVSEAISTGKAHLEFRYRYEHVDQDGFSRDAGASTLKTRLNFLTAPYKNFSMFIEVDDVSYLGSTNFNNTRNGKTKYPTVADPKGTDVNQLFIKLDAENASFKLGRQRINYDGQRFVGGVGWRQNEQTFDAFSIHSDHFKNFNISYSYVNNVSRIFGPDSGSPPDELDSNSHFLNTQINLGDNGKLAFYSYAMDFDDADGLSNLTTGISYSQTFKQTSFSVPLTLEFARQGDHGDNPTSYDANYYLVQVGAKFEKAAVSVGYEVLEGNDTPGEAFRTPLATLHKFQGWADKFLTTPDGGIEDTYVTFSYLNSYGKFAVTFHDFEAEDSGLSYGDEWDASFAHKFNDHYSILLKVADYNADKFSTDTLKGWLMFTAKF